MARERPEPAKEDETSTSQPEGPNTHKKESTDRKKMKMGWTLTHVPAGRLALAALWCVIRLQSLLDGIVLYVGEKMKDLRGTMIILDVLEADRNSFMILMDGEKDKAYQVAPVLLRPQILEVSICV